MKRIQSFFSCFAILLATALVGCDRPYLLTRMTAARAIEATSEFRHKTTLRFEITQAGAIIPPACHNVGFSPDHKQLFNELAANGSMQFSRYGNQDPPYPVPSAGSLDLSLSDPGYLVDDIQICRPRQVTNETGAYEVELGVPVVDVNGIRPDGNRSHVDFTWHFESLNELGRALTQVTLTREREMRDDHLAVSEKAKAPFWEGSAEFMKYDDGWRVVGINLQPNHRSLNSWAYGPPWPDPNFNWHAFDEEENHY